MSAVLLWKHSEINWIGFLAHLLHLTLPLLAFWSVVYPSPPVPLSCKVNCIPYLMQDSGEVNVENDRAHLLRSPAQQQTFTVSSEAAEAESREAAMLDLQVL